ncbi:helical backbone metal receptor [Solimicrobium silvestre]|uniref:Periplasmic binding protein n=1 Tax=Solimicrobium silvestre TaxID=2099400 RepID=A0A2S9GSC9_9BURK|nr:helical backbone metal receptor [Solimicrobium silvestre]PRC90629.1 Periplasmic binding protein [Solimicrobium silvestre]
MQWQDAIGAWHSSINVNDSAPRIVSLVPSITELLCDLGLAPHLVGRTGFCIHPHEVVQNIPKIGGTKDVNIEKIRALAPTHLIVNIDENEKPCVEQLAQFIPHVIVTHPQTLEDNLPLFNLLGGIFNVTERAQQLSQQFTDALSALQLSLPVPLISQRVLYCIWKDPWMTVSSNTYIANMLSHIGWQIIPTGTARYPVFTWSEQLVNDIDLVLLSSEPYRFTEQHVDALEQQCGKPVLLLDGEMISWYGSRSIAGINYLRELVAGAR